MRKLWILIIGLWLTGTVQAQTSVTGKSFPALEAETIDDMVINLPEDTKGKFTLLGLAYSKKSEDDLVTWFSPVYNKFIREATGLFSSFQYDVNVYFIPMFTGVKSAATGAAKKKAAKNIDPRLQPYVLFYKGALKPYKESLAFDKKDVPYFFVLDENGMIVYATSGEYTEKKMNDIEEFLDE